MADTIAPLEGILVIDLSQFLSGPCASLRLADLGARVIKVEKPVEGDLCRQLYVSDVVLDGESTVFHAINRNKESFVADLKTPEGLAQVRRLIRRADVVMHNFRPGVAERLELGYESVQPLNPQVVYGRISGYGQEGPWRDLPGQDLLLQSLSGLTWLSGDAGQGPVPMGLAIADILCGMHLAQGILACLVRRSITGRGGRVDVSLLESLLDSSKRLRPIFTTAASPPSGPLRTMPTPTLARRTAFIARATDTSRWRWEASRNWATCSAVGRCAIFRIPPRGSRNATASKPSSHSTLRAAQRPSGSPCSNPPISGAPTYWIGSACSSTTASKHLGCCRRFAALTERLTRPLAARFASTASGFIRRRARPTSAKTLNGLPESS